MHMYKIKIFLFVWIGYRYTPHRQTGTQIDRSIDRCVCVHSLMRSGRGWKSIRCRRAEPIVGGGVHCWFRRGGGAWWREWEWLRLMKIIEQKKWAWTHLSGIDQNWIDLNPSLHDSPRDGTVRDYKNIFIRRKTKHQKYMVSETSKTNCLAKDYWDDESDCQRKDFITGQTTYWSFTCYHTHSHTNTHR